MHVIHMKKIKKRVKMRAEERQLNKEAQRSLNLKVLKAFWSITDEELQHIPFTCKSVNDTPFVTPLFNIFETTRPYHIAENIYRNYQTAESNEKKCSDAKNMTNARTINI